MVCKVCNKTKNRADFYSFKKKNGLGLHKVCKPCWIVDVCDRRLVRNLKYNFGLSPKAYQELLTKYNHACAICKRHESTLKQRLNIDHDHACCAGQKTCGKCVRGLLCYSCNMALGLFRDDVIFLRTALAYLEYNAPKNTRQVA